MNKKVYGYIRVSTREQNEARQLIAMQKQGVPEENLFIDKQSGKDFERAGYRKMLKTLKPGDTLILKSLDRLGRDYKEVLEQWRVITKEKEVDVFVIDTPVLDTRRSNDLVGTLIADIILAVFSCVAEMERTFNHQRQSEGILAAKKRGVKFGRSPKARPVLFDSIREAWEKGQLSARRAARILGITHRTFLKWTRES